MDDVKNNLPVHEEKIKKAIKEEISTHIRILGINYKGRICYMEKDKDDGSCASEIFVDPSYYSYLICVYPCFFYYVDDVGKKEAVESMAHEVAHILTQPMKELIENPYKSEKEVKREWEQLTETIARLSLRIKELEKQVSENLKSSKVEKTF